MAHEIQQHDHMMSAKLTPWHKLGTVTADALNLDEALLTAKLDWTVSKHSAFTRTFDLSYEDAISKIRSAAFAKPELSFGELLTDIGFDLPIDDTYAMVRDDIRYPLGTVGGKYEPWQNLDSFNLAKVLLSGGDIKAETAGSLRNGRVVWLLCRLDKDLIVGGDEHKPYMLFTSSHDGSGKIRVMPTPVRVVCANTLRWALDGRQTSWTSSHTRGVHGRAANEARETLELAWKFYGDFENEVSKLMDQAVPEVTFEQIVFNTFPDPAKKDDGTTSERSKNNIVAKRDKVRSIYEHSPVVGQYKGTGWGVVQAFNSFDLWHSRVRGGEDNRSERQANRILTGETMANTSNVRTLLAAAAN